MKVIQTTIYECEYCKKYYKSKYHCDKHEKQCVKNPINIHKCFDCKHLDVIREIDDEVIYKSFHCKKLDKYMYTFKAETLRFQHLKEGVRMPLECKSYDIDIIGLDFEH